MRNIINKISIIVFIIISSSNYAQNSEVRLNTIFMESEIINEKLSDNSLSNFNQSVNILLDLDDNYSYETVENSELRDDIGYNHSKIQQFYKGFKIEYALLNIHVLNGEVTLVNGEYSDFLSLSTNASISEETAFNKALNHIKAEKYIWQDKKEYEFLLNNEGKEYSSLPVGELVICRNYNNLRSIDYRLAYKFDIYALNPLSRDYIYVDAINGEIIHTNAIIHTCNYNLTNHTDKMVSVISNPAFVVGSAQTRYSGTRSIETTAGGGGFQLRDYVRGLGVETYNMNNGTSYSSATNFTDIDNNWTAVEWHNSNKDDAALDAHWGAERTYDYFLSQHGRNSYNNSGAKIKSYIHYSTNYFNAFWNGSVMTYGDGSSINSNNPLTTVDICAHEIGHAICTHTANLVYSNEPGALNESFSDIWGACVEFFADPSKQTWVIGEDMLYPIRSLSNPNLYNQPDTYHGTNWYYGSGDSGGVHTNSGVQNFWFYLLTVGGSGTNDIGTNYNVSGIGIANAAAIAYRTESVYLTSTSNYSTARNLSIQAAKDLFGVNSQEAISTENAWCAVGIGSCIPNISCPVILAVTTNVTSGADTKQASSIINASNTINNGAIAIYHAGDEVLLSNGFTSNNGSVFRAYIEGCTNIYVARQANPSTHEEYDYEVQNVETETLKEQLKIAPNPNNGLFKLLFETVTDGEVEIVDLYGVTVYKSSFTNQKEIAISIQKSPKGIYILKVNTNSGLAVIEKIIKE